MKNLFLLCICFYSPSGFATGFTDSEIYQKMEEQLLSCSIDKAYFWKKSLQGENDASQSNEVGRRLLLVDDIYRKCGDDIAKKALKLLITKKDGKPNGFSINSIIDKKTILSDSFSEPTREKYAIETWIHWAISQGADINIGQSEIIEGYKRVKVPSVYALIFEQSVDTLYSALKVLLPQNYDISKTMFPMDSGIILNKTVGNPNFLIALFLRTNRFAKNISSEKSIEELVHLSELSAHYVDESQFLYKNFDGKTSSDYLFRNHKEPPVFPIAWERDRRVYKIFCKSNILFSKRCSTLEKSLKNLRLLPAKRNTYSHTNYVQRSDSGVSVYSYSDKTIREPGVWWHYRFPVFTETDLATGKKLNEWTFGNHKSKKNRRNYSFEDRTIGVKSIPFSVGEVDGKKYILLLVNHYNHKAVYLPGGGLADKDFWGIMLASVRSGKVYRIGNYVRDNDSKSRKLMIEGVQFNLEVSSFSTAQTSLDVHLTLTKNGQSIARLQNKGSKKSHQYNLSRFKDLINPALFQMEGVEFASKKSLEIEFPNKHFHHSVYLQNIKSREYVSLSYNFDESIKIISHGGAFRGVTGRYYMSLVIDSPDFGAFEYTGLADITDAVNSIKE